MSDASSLEPSENDPTVEEVSGNQVNVATRQANFSDILGEGDWEKQNWPEECYIVIDTGFNGG